MEIKDLKIFQLPNQMEILENKKKFYLVDNKNNREN